MSVEIRVTCSECEAELASFECPDPDLAAGVCSVIDGTSAVHLLAARNAPEPVYGRCTTCNGSVHAEVVTP